MRGRQRNQRRHGERSVPRPRWRRRCGLHRQRRRASRRPARRPCRPAHRERHRHGERRRRAGSRLGGVLLQRLWPSICRRRKPATERARAQLDNRHGATPGPPAPRPRRPAPHRTEASRLPRRGIPAPAGAAGAGGNRLQGLGLAHHRVHAEKTGHARLVKEVTDSQRRDRAKIDQFFLAGANGHTEQ